MLSAAPSCHSKLETNSKDSVALPKLSRQQTPPVMWVSKTLKSRAPPRTTPRAAYRLCTSSCDLHWQQVRLWHQLPRPNSASRQAEHQLIFFAVFYLVQAGICLTHSTLGIGHRYLPCNRMSQPPCAHPHTPQLGSSGRQGKECAGLTLPHRPTHIGAHTTLQGPWAPSPAPCHKLKRPQTLLLLTAAPQTNQIPRARP